MKFHLLVATMVVGYVAAACPMQNNKNKCNNDPMGCGWYQGDCVSCSMTMVKARCDQSMYCDWDMDESTCMKKEEPPKDCGMYEMMEECDMDDDCRWKKKKGVCVKAKTCEQIRSKRVCKKREECELKGKKCTTKYI